MVPPGGRGQAREDAEFRRLRRRRFSERGRHGLEAEGGACGREVNLTTRTSTHLYMDA